MHNDWQEYQLSKMRSNFLRAALAVCEDKEKRKVKAENETAILLIHLPCYLRYSGSGMMSAIVTLCNGNLTMVIKAQSLRVSRKSTSLRVSGITASLPDRFSPLNASFLS